MPGDIATFGPFRLNAAQRKLERDGEAVTVGSRALDILIALVERKGEVLSARELMARAWPNLSVEDGNLRVSIALLRRALGDGRNGVRYIVNLPGRGYCFTQPVEMDAPPDPDAARPSVHFMSGGGAAANSLLPQRLARMVGRDATVEALSALLLAQRFVSVIGPGGMGKTTVAVSVAHSLFDDFDGAIVFVDLGALSDNDQVMPSVASAMGVMAQVRDPVPSLVAFLRGRRLMLVLDNCEHVIDAVTELAERLFQGLPELHILATSRELLRADGEFVHYLEPLEAPANDDHLTAADALTYSSVQLFMERAIASGHRHSLGDKEAPLVAEICQRMDGIPLAIELAAGRVGAFGVAGTVALLENRFKLDWQGRRSALPRHQTLNAMLDWSYTLLAQNHRRVLRRLSIFVGVFSLDAAQAVATDEQVSPADLAEGLVALVDRSLVWSDGWAGTARYRLLETTRAYAFAKLSDEGEAESILRRHAEYFAALLQSEAAPVGSAAVYRVLTHAPDVGNLRAALEWSFGPDGDPALGCALAAPAAALFIASNLLEECMQWCERALSVLPPDQRDGLRQLVLQNALALSMMFSRGNTEEVRRTIDDGLSLARSLGERERELQLLTGLFAYATRTGDFRRALEVAKRCSDVGRDLAAPEPKIMSEWILGCGYHLVGDHAAANRQFRACLDQTVGLAPAELDYFGLDPRVLGLAMRARTQWLLGQPDRARRTAEAVFAEGEVRRSPVTQSMALIYGTTVLLWRGDLDEAERRIVQLQRHAAKFSLRPYQAVAEAMKAELLILRGAYDAGVSKLQAALTQLQAERHLVMQPAWRCILAEGLLHSGADEEAERVTDAALGTAQDMGLECNIADILRVRGEIRLRDLARAGQAEADLIRSMALARVQGALGLELRAANVLAEAWREQGRRPDAAVLLRDVYDRFTEGHDTSDLRNAAAILESLGSSPTVAPGHA